MQHLTLLRGLALQHRTDRLHSKDAIQYEQGQALALLVSRDYNFVDMLQIVTRLF